MKQPEYLKVIFLYLNAIARNAKAASSLHFFYHKHDLHSHSSPEIGLQVKFLLHLYVNILNLVLIEIN